MIASQYDFQPGLDLAPLTSATLAQIMQSISQIAPLSNIGGVIFSTSTPSIGDNARFERYIWLDDNTDPPTPKYYNVGTASWDAIQVSAATIGPTQLAAHTTVLDHFFNATVAVPASASKLLRFDSAGDLIEAVTLATILAANTVPLSALDKTSAADKQIIQYRSSDGLLILRTVTPSDLFAAASVGLNLLAAGTNNHILQCIAGVWTSVATNNFLTDGDVGVNKISSTGATALQVVTRNAANNANEWATPILSKEFSNSAVATIAAGLNINIAHGFGAMPKMFKAVLVNVITEGGWSVSDEVDIASFTRSAGGDLDGRTEFFVGASSSTIYAGALDVSALTGKRRDTGASFAVTAANWRMKVYCYV